MGLAGNAVKVPFGTLNALNGTFMTSRHARPKRREGAVRDVERPQRHLHATPGQAAVAVPTAAVTVTCGVEREPRDQRFCNREAAQVSSRLITT